MKKTQLLVLLLSLLLAVFIVGCEGEQGPEGPAGPGEKVAEYTFLGNMGEDCMHCHATTVAQWASTGHVNAYESLVEGGNQENPYCLKCHTTGWDSPVAYGATEITEFGPDKYGFDDYWGKETDEAIERRHALEGVQCESCHGAMGPDFNAHRPEISFSTHNDADGNSTSSCSPCHSGQLEEWLESGHGNAGGTTVEEFNGQHYAHRAECNVCHTSEGFIREHDPKYATYEFPHEVSQIGCVTCHDPHSGGNAAQIRDLGDVMVSYYDDELDIPTMSGFGTGQVCSQCHHARPDFASVQGQIDNGAGRIGPHHSNQMDVFIGYGSYEIPGYEYERVANQSHNNITNACVGCHMTRSAEIHGEVQEHAFHTFAPEVGSCDGCHIGVTDIESLRADLITEIEDKFTQIAILCGYSDSETFFSSWNADNRSKERWQREIAYAAVFVHDDGSMGTHNPTYANSLLDNAIEYGNAQAAK